MPSNDSIYYNHSVVFWHLYIIVYFLLLQNINDGKTTPSSLKISLLAYDQIRNLNFATPS